MSKLFGGILIGCGIVIAGLSGLCLLVVGGSFLAEFGSDGGAGEFLSFLPTALIFAGVPLAAGVGMFFLGRHLIRRADEQKLDIDRTNPFE